MKKIRRIYATWDSGDLKFLKSLNLKMSNNDIGYSSFDIEESSEIYKELQKKFFQKKRSDFFDSQIGTIFSKEEINSSEYFSIQGFGIKGYPLPTKDFGYLDKTYVDYYKSSGIRRLGQPKPFLIKKEPTWKKNELIFTLNWVPDALFVKREFFEKILVPLGFSSREVLLGLKGMKAETVVQWDIPLCTSKMKLEGSLYDTGNICSESRLTKYSQQILDFLPPFKEILNQDICLCQEFFGEGFEANHKIIINKKLKDFFAKYKILKSDLHLHPVRKS